MHSKWHGLNIKSWNAKKIQRKSSLKIDIKRAICISFIVKKISIITSIRRQLLSGQWDVQSVH